MNLTSSKVFPLNTSEYLCSLRFLSHSETVIARLRCLNVQLTFPEQDRCRGNDGELAGDVTGDPFEDGGDGYDVTGDEGMVSCSDVRDDGREECKPLEVSMCNMLLGIAAVIKGLNVRELWDVVSRVPIYKQEKDKVKMRTFIPVLFRSS